ncbi:MAG: hypothetical protein NZ839_03875, partial [Endomicrobia bacterium]|nr:hypothetical protein [Endomicrobiia bacterium]
MSNRQKKIQKNKKNYIKIFLLLSILVILLYLPTTLWHFPDGIGYYSYLPAIFSNKNYDFYKIKKVYTPGILGTTQNGFIVNDFDIGCSIIWLPIYLFSLLFEDERISILFINFFSSLLGIGSLFLIFSFLKEKFFLKTNLSLFISINLLLGTPILFYCYSIPQNPHTTCSLFSSLFLYFLLSKENEIQIDSNCYSIYIILGLLLGLLSSIRIQRVVLGIPLLLITLLSLRKIKDLKNFAINLVVFFSGFIIGYSPQLINSKILFNQFLPPKLYTISINKYIFSSLYEIFFSSYHSVLLWTPLIILSIFGLLLGLKFHFLLSFSLLLIFAIETFVIASVISPGAGASFGIRYYTDLIFIFGIGIYFLFKFCQHNILRVIIIITLLICSTWSFILFLLTTSGKIDLLEVYPTKVFFQTVITEIQNLTVSLKPRIILEKEIYLFLFCITVIVFLFINKILKFIRKQHSFWNISLVIITYLLLFNFNLIKAGYFNRVVYKKDIFEQTFTLQDYQKFYTLAGIKIRLKYYNIKKQREKYEFYNALKIKLQPHNIR